MDRTKLIRTASVGSLAALALASGTFLTWNGWKTWHVKREYERVRTLASNLANDEFESRFHRRPFRPDTYEAWLTEHRWYWGRFEPADFFSAEVSFQKDGTDPQVRVFWSTDGPEPIEPIEHRHGPPPNETMPGPTPYLIDK